MANYEYSSYSSSSSNNLGGAGVNAAFNAADTNQDGVLSQGEFSNFLGGAAGGAGLGVGVGVGGAGGNYSSSSYESSSYSSTGGALGVDAGLVGVGGATVAGFDAGAGLGGSSSYQASSYESSTTGGAGFDATAVSQAAGYTAQTNAAWSQYGAEVRAPGLFVDTNPQVVRRPAPGGVQTYTQNIKVRFLQPPPVPPPGVSNLSSLV